MTPRRCRSLAALLAAGLAAAVGPAAASAQSADSVVVDAATTPDGPQLVVRINGSNRTLLRPEADGRLEFIETGNFTMQVGAGAAGRCRLDPENDSSVSCSIAGLLTATPSRKPLRFELGPDSGRFDASESPLAIEVAGGVGNDDVAGTPFDDLITLGAGRDSTAGGLGRDVIDLGPDIDQARGGPGDDRIDGGDGSDWMEGGSGRDELIGGAGDDLVAAEPAVDGDSDVKRLPDGQMVEWADVPSECGAGNDTVVIRTPALDPVLPSCEHTMVAHVEAPLTITGTTTVGSELVAKRNPVGVPASFRSYLWASCDSIDAYTSAAYGCVARSSCPTLRLEAQDEGKQIRLILRTTYTLAGGQFKIQPGDDLIWTALKVGEYREPLTPNYLESQPSDSYSQLFIRGIGQLDRTGDSFGQPLEGQKCTDLADPPEPEPVAEAQPAATPAPSPMTTPAPVAQPTPQPSQQRAPGAGVRPSARSATAADGALAKRLAKALGRASARSVLRARRLVVKATAEQGTVIRVQVRRGSRWTTVGVGRRGKGQVTVVVGSTGRARLRAAVRAKGSIRLRVVVRAPGRIQTATALVLRR